MPRLSVRAGLWLVLSCTWVICLAAQGSGQAVIVEGSARPDEVVRTAGHNVPLLHALEQIVPPGYSVNVPNAGAWADAPVSWRAGNSFVRVLDSVLAGNPLLQAKVNTDLHLVTVTARPQRAGAALGSADAVPSAVAAQTASPQPAQYPVAAVVAPAPAAAAQVAAPIPAAAPARVLAAAPAPIIAPPPSSEDMVSTVSGGPANTLHPAMLVAAASGNINLAPDPVSAAPMAAAPAMSTAPAVTTPTLATLSASSKPSYVAAAGAPARPSAEAANKSSASPVMGDAAHVASPTIAVTPRSQPGVAVSDQIETIAPPTQDLAASAALPVWELRISDRSVKSALARWAADAGWQFVWDVPTDFTIDASATIHGSFQDALHAVVDALRTSQVPIQVLLYKGNRVVRVVAKGAG
jgi:hypothetical protein